MPSLISKRGKKRWRAAVMVNGQKKEKLFKDGSKAEYRKAILWEKEEKERLKEEQTTMDCLTTFDWSQDYLDYAQSNFGVKTYKEKRGVFKRLFKFKDVDADSDIESLTPSVVMACLMEQTKERSGNAANKDRKNLAAGWEWGRKYINGFPQQMLNPFRAVDKFPEKRHPRYVPPETIVPFKKKRAL